MCSPRKYTERLGIQKGREFLAAGGDLNSETKIFKKKCAKLDIIRISREVGGRVLEEILTWGRYEYFLGLHKLRTTQSLNNKISHTCTS